MSDWIVYRSRSEDQPVVVSLTVEPTEMTDVAARELAEAILRVAAGEDRLVEGWM